MAILLYPSSSIGMQAVLETYGLIFMHEAAHALSASFLFENANPHIKLDWNGGMCTYNATTLSSYGEKIGRKNAKMLVSASGPLVDIANLLDLTRPSRKKAIPPYLTVDILGGAMYALSGLMDCGSDPHDYCHVKAMNPAAHFLLTASTLGACALALFRMWK